MFNRQPIAWTTAFSAIISIIVLAFNTYNSESTPDISAEVVAGVNIAFAAIIALVANVTATPVNDARLANGSQVNSGQSVVVPVNSLSDVAAANVITPVSAYPTTPRVGGA